MHLVSPAFAFLSCITAVSSLLAGGENIIGRQHHEEANSTRIGKSRIYLQSLISEKDPDVRRHLLFELSLATNNEGDHILKRLLDLFPTEKNESVSLAYLTTVATLLEKTKPGTLQIEAQDFLQQCAFNSPSISMRIQAFNILSFKGKADSSLLPEMTALESIQPEVLHALPAALLRTRNDKSSEILRSLASFDQDSHLALEVAACQQQLGDFEPAELIGKVMRIVDKAGDEKTTIKAGVVLLNLSQKQPAMREAVREVIKQWQQRGSKGYTSPVLSAMLGENEGVSAPLAAYAFTPQNAYNYASAWWGSANHSCSSAYSSCTPWSYWGSEVCGYTSHGGDCANFVSQCLIAGGHAYLSGGDPCRGYPCGKEEIGAAKLGNCLVQKGWVRTCGYLKTPPSNIAVGDVLIYHGGSCTDSDAHATFVMYVSGSDVRIACHSSKQWNKSYTYMSTTKPYYEWLHNPNNTPTETISTPNTPTGSSTGKVGSSYTLNFGGAASNLGHALQYYVEWGDGSNWMATGATSATKTWTYSGNYSVRVKARCATHPTVISNWSAVKTVVVSPADPTDPYEPNNTSTAATPVSSGVNYQGLIGVSGDTDWFKFTLTSQKTVTITCQTPSGSNFDMELYNPSYVTGSYNAAGALETITRTLAAGTYYVRIYGVSGAYNTASTYSLKVAY